MRTPTVLLQGNCKLPKQAISDTYLCPKTPTYLLDVCPTASNYTFGGGGGGGGYSIFFLDTQAWTQHLLFTPPPPKKKKKKKRKKNLECHSGL